MKKTFSEFGESPNANSVDNAEPRVPVTELAYLAGIFDGEGSLLIQRERLDENGNRRGIRIGFHITNSCLFLLGKCQQTIQSLIGRPIKLYRKPLYKNSIVHTNKEIWTIDLRKQTELLVIFKAIQPYLTTKKSKVDDAIEYLKFRLKERESMSNRLSDVSERMINEFARKHLGVTTKREAPIIG